MAGLIEAIDIKRKMFFEFENAPYHCLDVEISKPTARGGQTLVRVKMRNLLTRAVFDKTFKAGEKFAEPDLDTIDASFMYADSARLPFHGPGKLRDPHAQRRQGRRRPRTARGQPRSSRFRSTTATPSACSSRRTWS